MSIRQQWEELLQVPSNYVYNASITLCKYYSFSNCDAELYQQANGPRTFQRVLKVFPKNIGAKKIPAVVTPYYFPEGMLGFELETKEELSSYKEVAMMAHWAERGFASISADAYHLNYLNLDLSRNDFHRWHIVGNALTKDYPSWCGMGKLHSDTTKLIDALMADDRIDHERIGIAGHSLGGKMAFYTGCLDSRVKAVLVSDFGFAWEQSNWSDVWYFGKKLDEMKKNKLDHTQILNFANGKPFLLLAGQDDNAQSYELMIKAKSYQQCLGNLHFINHATGHRPPEWALNLGYDFLEQVLK